MSEIILERLVIVWHHRTWCVWEDNDNGEDGKTRPLKESRHHGDGSKALRITMDRSYLFGPTGEQESRYDYALPWFVNSELAIKQTPKGPEMSATNIIDGQYWQFGFDGELITRRRPIAADAWQIGCATFMAVLVSQYKNHLLSMHEILDRFFSEKYEKDMLRIMGVPRILSVGMILQVNAKNGTYLVPLTREVELGRGVFGEVRKGVDNATGKVYAVKICTGVVGGDMDRSPGSIKEKRNLCLLEFINHNHIVKFQDLHNNGNVTVMEYIPCGSAADLYGGGMAWPSHNLFRLAMQIGDALHYLHTEHKLAHRDIQPKNILVRQLVPLRVVLADFGHASLRRDPPVYGHHLYRAPETWEAGHEFHVEPDVWSLGVTVFKLAVQPHVEFDPGQGAARSLFPFMVYEKYRDNRHRVAPTIRILILVMLHKDPTKRYSAGQASGFADIVSRYADKAWPDLEKLVYEVLKSVGCSDEEIKEITKPGFVMEPYRQALATLEAEKEEERQLVNQVLDNIKAMALEQKERTLDDDKETDK